MLTWVFVGDENVLCFRINLGTLLCTLQPGKVILTSWKCCLPRVSVMLYLMWFYKKDKESTHSRSPSFFGFISRQMRLGTKRGRSRQIWSLIWEHVVTDWGNNIQHIVLSFVFFYVSFPVLSVWVCLFSDPRTDIRNNEKKLALDMATNAQCASLLKRKQGNSKYSCH